MGQVTPVRDTPPSICDSLQAPAPGDRPFRIMKENCKRGISVSDADAINAMRVAFDMLKLVLEPGGAVALAAAMTHKIETSGRTLCVVASGGNVAWSKFQQALSQP